jgi:hypothetical protein
MYRIHRQWSITAGWLIWRRGSCHRVPSLGSLNVLVPADGEVRLRIAHHEAFVGQPVTKRRQGGQAADGASMSVEVESLCGGW